MREGNKRIIIESFSCFYLLKACLIKVASKRGFGKFRRLSRLFQLYRGKCQLKECMAIPIKCFQIKSSVGPNSEFPRVFSGFPPQNILPKYVLNIALF